MNESAILEHLRSAQVPQRIESIMQAVGATENQRSSLRLALHRMRRSGKIRELRVGRDIPRQPGDRSKIVYTVNGASPELKFKQIIQRERKSVVELKFWLERETKNTYRFQELSEDGEVAGRDNAIMGRVYVSKAFFNGGPQPKAIIIRLEK